MNTKNLILSIASLFLLLATSCLQPTTKEFTSPSGNLKVVVGLCPETEGLYYQLFVIDNGNPIEAVKPSPLGIAYNNEDFSSKLTLKGFSDPTVVKDAYSLKIGKKKEIEATGNEFTVAATNANGKEIQVRFRLYDDGLAFQYLLQGEGEATVKAESTGFAIPTDGKAWIHPYDIPREYDAPSYETPCEVEIAVGTTAPSEERDGWAFPMLFNANNVWTLITEAGTEAFNYGGTHINPECPDGLYTVCFAGETESGGLERCSNLPQVQLPFATNWRVIICGKDPATLVESSLVQTLNPPTPYTDLDWIKPGIAAWSWWSARQSPRDYDLMLSFIDMAAQFGWPYHLTDGGWPDMKNGNLEKLLTYAHAKNVDLWVWYDSGVRVHYHPELFKASVMYEPESRKNEMKRLSELGVKGVKIDFFNSDKPCVLKLYEEILKDAMEARLMVNFHGCTMPRGWERTYPNLMTMEAVMGEECYDFRPAYAEQTPALNTVIPFSRNVVGPADYTPLQFSNEYRRYRRITTVAHELALPILIESGTTHMVDHHSSLAAAPDYVKALLSELPTTWDETKLLAGYPGKEVVLARRSGSKWYIAGINGENAAKELTISLAPLSATGALNLISDGTTMQNFTQTAVQPTEGQTVTVKMLPYGGFAATLQKE